MEDGGGAGMMEWWSQTSYSRLYICIYIYIKFGYKVYYIVSMSVFAFRLKTVFHISHIL